METLGERRAISRLPSIPGEQCSSIYPHDEATVYPPRLVTRTPSPTLDEMEMLAKVGLYGRLDLRRPWKYFRRRYIATWLFILVTIAITILTIIYNNKIVKFIAPFGRTLKRSNAGWLVPVAITIVLSFPPLDNTRLLADLIASVCGIYWSGPVALGIVVFGNLLGELANYILNRFIFREQQEKKKESDLKTGLLSQVVKEGGFITWLLIRQSIVPPHFATLVFSLCDLDIVTFSTVTILSCPRQALAVWLGVTSREQAYHIKDNSSTWITIAIAVVTINIISISSRFVGVRVDAIKPRFIHARRKARQQRSQGIELDVRDTHRSSESRGASFASPQPRTARNSMDNLYRYQGGEINIRQG